MAISAEITDIFTTNHHYIGIAQKNGNASEHDAM